MGDAGGKIRAALRGATSKAKDGVDHVQRAREIAQLEREIGRAYFDRKRGHPDVDLDIAELMERLAALDAAAAAG